MTLLNCTTLKPPARCKMFCYTAYITRKPCYRKDDRAMRPI